MGRNGPNNRNGLPESTSIIYVDCIRTGWPSIVTESAQSENYGAKFVQMNILTHENMTLYGGVITCLPQCMQY